jgi:hypothetical protein
MDSAEEEGSGALLGPNYPLKTIKKAWFLIRKGLFLASKWGEIGGLQLLLN